MDWNLEGMNEKEQLIHIRNCLFNYIKEVEKLPEQHKKKCPEVVDTANVYKVIIKLVEEKIGKFII